MSTLLIAMLLAAGGPVEDPRGFHFEVPAGFEAFPGFKPTGNKLYAFGKDLGTPGAITLTLDVLDGPAVAGTASRSCGALLNSIDRTVGTPVKESWQGAELSGLRMVMTHVFGEVLVLCVDLPVSPNGISVMVSGKPENEAGLREAFNAVLGSLKQTGAHGVSWLELGLVVAVAASIVAWRIRASLSRKKQ